MTDRYEALGLVPPPVDEVCQGQCEGTGWIPVKLGNGMNQSDLQSADETDKVLIALWREAEAELPSDDGWHFVVCPNCAGTGYRTTGST